MMENRVPMIPATLIQAVYSPTTQSRAMMESPALTEILVAEEAVSQVHPQIVTTVWIAL
jgi:hypothetical protein